MHNICITPAYYSLLLNAVPFWVFLKSFLIGNKMENNPAETKSKNKINLGTSPSVISENSNETIDFVSRMHDVWERHPT